MPPALRANDSYWWYTCSYHFLPVVWTTRTEIGRLLRFDCPIHSRWRAIFQWKWVCVKYKLQL